MNDAEKVREFIENQRGSFRVLALYESILTELAEANRKLAHYAVEGDRHDGSCLQVKSEALERAVAAEERARKAEAIVKDKLGATGVSLAHSLASLWMTELHRRENAYLARIQELEAENDRLRQGLVEALEEQP